MSKDERGPGTAGDKDRRGSSGLRTVEGSVQGLGVVQVGVEGRGDVQDSKSSRGARSSHGVADRGVTLGALVRPSRGTTSVPSWRPSL